MKTIFLIFVLLGLSQTYVVAQESTDSVMLPAPIIIPSIIDLVIIDGFHPNGYCSCGREAQFPGGSAAMQKWIDQNVVYPYGALECGIEGRVHVNFIVEKDGSISNVEIAKGISYSLNQEAKRLIKTMPYWITSEYGCENVRTRARVPISFVLL